MDSENNEKKTFMQAKTMAELLPSLSGILSKDAIHTLTAKKQPRQTMAVALTRTNEKNLKPLTIAEMRSQLQVLMIKSPKRAAQAATSSKRKGWNSSVKLENKNVPTAAEKLKHNPVRKMLNFQSRSTLAQQVNSRNTVAAETPKFSKQISKLKKNTHLPVKTNARMSGINCIPETPVERSNNVVRSRLTFANKENMPYRRPLINKTLLPPPKPLSEQKSTKTAVPDSPISNNSWKSSCDASFLQREKEVNEVEEKDTNLLKNVPINEEAMSVSTPFKEYRNVQDYFNNSSVMENSAVYHDNTIMCFDKQTDAKVETREESVIVSLCDLLNKATFKSTEDSSEVNDLLEVEKQTKNNIQMIENGIQTLIQIKESQLQSLQRVRKLIKEKDTIRAKENNGKIKLIIDGENVDNSFKTDEDKSSNCIGKSCSVIKSCHKSPTYKIPSKNSCLRKKIICKSMPNITNKSASPIKLNTNRALSMYMKIKETMNFLNTPVAKKESRKIHDTPAVTSHNLQKQLDKLYGGS